MTRTHAFGFARPVRDAGREQFPRGYGARCLIRPVPQGVTAPVPELAFRAAA